MIFMKEEILDKASSKEAFQILTPYLNLKLKFSIIIDR